MRFDISWKGLEELEVTIANAHSKAVEQSIKVTKNHAEEGKKIAKQFAPHDTGFLKDHILTKHEGMISRIESQAGYSGFLEYGTRFMSAQPYMNPMLKYIQPKYRLSMERVMKKEVF